MTKDVGLPPSLDEFNAAMDSRYTEDQPPEVPAQQTAALKPAKPKEDQPSMTRRSWLLPVDVADGLADAANRIHHGSQGRVTKSEAQAALIRAGLDHEEEIAQRLGATDRT